jgi:thiamine biosynthesis lipoprotein
MKEIVHKFFAFGGARCEIASLDGDERAVSTAVEDVYEFQSALSRFEPTSELSRFNAHAGVRVQVSPLLEALLRASLVAFEISDGLVSAASGNAVIAAGYDRSITAVKRSPGRLAASSPPPDLPDALQVWRGSAALRPGTALDLGGVGKGWLADLMIDRFDNGVVNLGGDLRARGDGRDGSGWRVALVDGSALRLRDGGVATSGVGERRWAGGHHIIDPRTGTPATTDLDSVCVAASTTFRAEVFAKGALIVGSADASSWLSKRGVQYHGMIAKVAA